MSGSTLLAPAAAARAINAPGSLTNTSIRVVVIPTSAGLGLGRSAWHRLVQEERGAIEMKTRDTAKIPKKSGPKGALVPRDR